MRHDIYYIYIYISACFSVSQIDSMYIIMIFVKLGEYNSMYTCTNHKCIRYIFICKYICIHNIMYRNCRLILLYYRLIMHSPASFSLGFGLPGHDMSLGSTKMGWVQETHETYGFSWPLRLDPVIHHDTS